MPFLIPSRATSVTVPPSVRDFFQSLLCSGTRKASVLRLSVNWLKPPFGRNARIFTHAGLFKMK